MFPPYFLVTAKYLLWKPLTIGLARLRGIFLHMIRLLNCLMGGKKVPLCASARFDAGILMQSDDKYATITAVLARLTLVHRNPAWAIL